MPQFPAGIEELWVETHGDPRVSVAILDGPVDRSHRSLRNAALTEIDPVKPCPGIASRHGTYIASLIFGQHDGPVLGIAPRCRGLIIPIFRNDDSRSRPACSQEELGRAIELAVQAGANVINISAGELWRGDPIDPILERAVESCVASGVLIVAAAGNQGHSRLQVPGALPGVLAVGAMNGRGEPLESSNWSDVCDACGLLAPGEGIPGALAGDGIVLESGTSCAVAAVAGVVALLVSLQLKWGGNADTYQVREILIASAARKEGESTRLLAGRLNVMGAASLLKQRLGASGVAPTRPASSICASYSLNPQALKDRYNGVFADRFGTVDIKLPDGASYNVRDLWYVVGPNQLGMRFVPVGDDRPSGYTLIDDLLRREMGLRPDDPIYAFLSYIRPEEHSFQLFQLPASQKLQLGHRHLGAYLGKGRTSHIMPGNGDWKGDGPLNMKWNVDRYPANVQVISLHGVPQATLNRNAHIVNSILASKGQAPIDSQTLACRTIDINTTLQFYRDTIRRADYLEDLSWFTNCAVHAANVFNTLVNVPHNQDSFEEIFGGDGAGLWRSFQQYYQEVTGRAFGSDDETHFAPLWRLAGLSAEEIRPLSFREYNAHEAAKSEVRLDKYTGPRPLEPGKGLAWPLETVTDLVGRMLETYASLPDAGGVNAAALLLVLRYKAQSMLCLSEDAYVELVKPIVAALIAADIVMNVSGDPRRRLAERAKELQALLRQVDAEYFPERSPRSIDDSAIRELVDTAAGQLAEIPARSGSAAEWFERAMKPSLIRLRRLSMSGSSGSGLFSTPSIIHQLARGLHPSSPFVRVRSICTVMDDRELLPDSPRVSPGKRACANSPPVETTEGWRMEKQNKGEMQIMAETRVPFDAPGGAPAVIPSTEGIEPAADCACKAGDDPTQLVYALGQVGYDFPSESRLNSVRQKMGVDKRPDEPGHVLEHLHANPHDASAIQWVLKLENAPIYAIEPAGPFAREAYDLLRRFVREQIEEGVERVSIPGVISGTRRLRSGTVVPAVQPEVRGMYSWTTGALVAALTARQAEKRAKGKSDEEGAKTAEGIRNFLDRVYYQIRNLGRTPQERAINFAATNAFEIGRVYEQAIRDEMELDTVEVQRSPISKIGTDCWDVSLMFFYPQRQVQTVRKVYRFAVDVADVVPSTVGQVRSWSIR